MAFAASGAFAQAEGGLFGGSAGQGIRAGNFVLYPTLELIYQHETNLFLTPPNVEPVDSSSYVARPKILIEMPFLRTYLRAGYMGEYRTYDADEYDQPERWTHLFILDASVRAANGLRASVQNRYMRSLLYTEEFDPNREVQFGRLPFVKNHVTADVGYQFNPRFEMAVFGSFLTVRFDDDADPTVTRNFYDHSAYALGIRSLLRVTPLTSVFLEAERTTAKRDRAYQDPALADDMESTAYVFKGGISGSLSPTMSGNVFFGYERSEYDEAPGNSMLTQGEYRGLIMGVDISNRFSPHTTLAGRIWREENQSASLGSNYYTTVGGTITATHQISRAVFSSLGLVFQQNSYPAETPAFNMQRDDDLYSIRAGLGFYFNERASVRVNYQYREQDSNLPFDLNDYRTSIYTVEAQIGW